MQLAPATGLTMLSPAPPGKLWCAGCLHPCRAQQDAVWGCSVQAVQPPPAGKCRHREVQHLALGAGKAPVWEGGCSEIDGLIKLPFVRLNCKNEPPALQQVPHFIYCSYEAGHDIGPGPHCPSSPSLTLAELIFPTDLTPLTGA